MLGIGNYLGMGKRLSEAASEDAPALEHAGTTGASALRWAIPLVVVLGALFLYQHNQRGNVGGTADETSSTCGTGDARTAGSRLGANETLTIGKESRD